jgi:hypothetical protein
MVWRKTTKAVEPFVPERELPQLPRLPEARKEVPKQKEVTKVVIKLPVQEVRQYTDEEGTIINLVTVEEALTELMEIINAGDK